jgi:hypothetical protein
MPVFPELLPGDVLLFERNTFYNRLIQIKTWSRFTHVEIVCVYPNAATRTVASRNGEGVGFYAPNLKGLAVVLRPRTAFDQDAAMKWFLTVQGQGYDWLGLMNFAYARLVGPDNNKQFCSEFAARYMRRGGVPVFGVTDADTISPRDFSICDLLEVVWTDGK